MQTIEYRTVDKSTWGPGSWQDEPDKVQFPDPATGLPCLILRNRSGALCGYVGLPPEHPLHGVQYEDLDVSVHGDLTFAGACSPGEDESHGICHIPASGEPDHVWWLGFDCNHGCDYAPAYATRVPGYLRDGGTYRDIAYVKKEIASLAQQLAALA